MAPIALAFLWHQHQPYYPDDVAGENPMPWVRLHGVKDYYGMAMHLLEFPEMRCTINLVPSLVRQLQAYTDRGATDEFLRVARVPASDLTEKDSLFLLDHYFMANAEQMIRPYPRYADLHQRRAPGRNTAREALRRFQERDLRDLQVWFNLTWVHPIAFEKDEGLRALRDKGRGFTEAEKDWLLEKQIAILREVLPLHRRLAETGQVELTTTPYFHPILPLLLDKKLAREAMPEVRLPRYSGGYPEDAALHVRRAVEQHQQVFGTRPRGLWPAEGSVCQAMLPLLREHGIDWIATDEEVLFASTAGSQGRDMRPGARTPDRLYRPYRVGSEPGELAIVFRDHALSDLIGFHYQRTDARTAADDFIGRLRAIGQAIHGDTPALVSVILDGENCWEYYPGGGVDFLRALYAGCTRTKDLRPVQIGSFLQEHPPQERLENLAAGSWINHNFAIWVGHPEDNAAWDALHRTREHLRQAEPRMTSADQKQILQRAWEEIYIAEGSDWFWWFGEDHSSAQDALFDELFRKHLQNVYLLLGDKPPADLAQPIKRRGQNLIHTLPRSFLDVKIDGRHTFFEWIGAGRYVCQNERATMNQGAPGIIKEVFFGFNLKALLIRIDFQERARAALAAFDALHLIFENPTGWELVIGQPGQSGQSHTLLRAGEVIVAPEIAVGIDHIAELSLPLEPMGIGPEQPIQWFVELKEGRQGRDRAPRAGLIDLICPSADFEQVMWDV